MKSDLLPEKRFFIECCCYSPDHLLIFDINDYEYDENKYDDPKNPKEVSAIDVDVFFTHNWTAPWRTRLRLALKYLFNREKYSIGDTVIINELNLKQLEDLVKALKTQKKTIDAGKKPASSEKKVKVEEAPVPIETLPPIGSKPLIVREKEDDDKLNMDNLNKRLIQDMKKNMVK
ncbi:MAG TPA: hypothetical protein P5136_00150 [Methanofastidiosum sp.]|nr:hypothetical protein [Methanofastidiosum sp.]